MSKECLDLLDFYLFGVYSIWEDYLDMNANIPSSLLVSILIDAAVDFVLSKYGVLNEALSPNKTK